MPDFLSSFKALADEWILVDTGSNDNSVAIANARGINCIYYEWQNHFANARNYSIKQAQSEWIFIADVDDRIKPEDAQKLREFLAITNCLAVTINYVNLAQSDWLQESPVELNRQRRMVCFRNGFDIHYRGAVHEDPMASIERIQGEVIHLDIPVFHLGYVSELISTKVVRNTELLESRWLAGDRDPDLVHYYTSLHWGPQEWIRNSLENALKLIDSRRNLRIIEDLYLWCMDFDINSCPSFEADLINQLPGSYALILRAARQSFSSQKSEEALELYQQLWNASELSYPLRYRSEVTQRLAFLHACAEKIDRAREIIDSYKQKFSMTSGIWHLNLKLLASQNEWNEIEKILKQPIPDFLQDLDEFKKSEIYKILLHCPQSIQIPDKLKSLYPSL